MNAGTEESCPVRRPTPQELTAENLAAAAPAMQKQMLGERLYPLIVASEPALAGKVTGLLLQRENVGLLPVLEDPVLLKAEVAAALLALDAQVE